MARTSDPEVRGVIESKAPDQVQGDIKMDLFIDAATNLVDWLEANCDAFSTLSDAQKRNVETWLAAHFYSRRDFQYNSNSTQGASGSYQNQTALHLDGSIWGQTAMVLDVSGCLAQIQLSMETGRRVASMGWLGKPKSEQIAYRLRN